MELSITLRFVFAFFLFTSIFPVKAIASPPPPIQIFAESGQIQRSLKEYRKRVQQTGEHDYDLLQCIAKNTIASGWREPKIETKLYALFGALIAEDDEVNNLLENPFLQHPALQLMFLNMLKMQKSPLIEAYCDELLRSPILEIRFHTLNYLASLGHPKAFAQIQALSAKLPVDWQALFSSLAAKIPGQLSSQYLGCLLSSPNRRVKINTIAALTEAGRKDFFPSILLNKNTRDPLMQEAIICAIKAFGDSSHTGILYSYTDSTSTDVRAAAYQALKELQDPRGEKGICMLVNEDILSAIELVNSTSNAESVLSEISKSKNRHVQLNALIQLALMGSSQGEAFLKKELFEKRIVVEKHFSPLKSVHHYLYRGHTYYEQYLSDTNELKIQLLNQAYQNDEQSYYSLAKKVLTCFQDPLAPKVIEDLGKLSTESSISLLKEFSEKPGDPFVRTYCHAELYRRTQSLEHFEKVKAFILDSKRRSILLFQNPLEKPLQKDQLPLLSLEKESKLYFDLFILLALSQDERVIDLLVESMDEGPKENSYILAGLLLKATL